MASNKTLFNEEDANDFFWEFSCRFSGELTFEITLDVFLEFAFGVATALFFVSVMLILWDRFRLMCQGA